MNLIGTTRATQDADFQSRVRAAMVLTGVDILNAHLPQGHPREVAAMAVLQNPEGNHMYARFLWLTAANPAIAGSVDAKSGRVMATDSDIHYVVSGAWHALFPDPKAPLED